MYYWNLVFELTSRKAIIAIKFRKYDYHNNAREDDVGTFLPYWNERRELPILGWNPEYLWQRCRVKYHIRLHTIRRFPVIENSHDFQHFFFYSVEHKPFGLSNFSVGYPPRRMQIFKFPALKKLPQNLWVRPMLLSWYNISRSQVLLKELDKCAIQ